METGTMKDQLSFTALWLAPALAILALTTAGHTPSVVLHDIGLAIIAEASVSPKDYSNCGAGIKGQYSNVHGGWVCSTELTADPDQ
jgi:hypothetical protein